MENTWDNLNCELTMFGKSVRCLQIEIEVCHTHEIHIQVKISFVPLVPRCACPKMETKVLVNPRMSESTTQSWRERSFFGVMFTN